MEQLTIALNLADYDAQKAAGAMKLLRLQPDHYQLVVRRFDPSTGRPASPDVVAINRDGAKMLADGIQKQIAELEASIAAKKKAITHLTVTIPADMDALDAQAVAAGDI